MLTKYEIREIEKELGVKIFELIQWNQESDNFKLIIAIASLLILGGLILLLSRIKSNNRLKAQTTITEKALEERELLLREIHHRVKNNLQVVSSLLSMQSRDIKDEKALQAVNDSRARVKSMALIHQDLYK